MNGHNIDLVHDIDVAQGTGTRGVEGNQTARRAKRGV